MAKRSQFYSSAKHLYVDLGFTYEDTAKQLKIAIKTVQKWATEDKDARWDAERNAKIADAKAFHTTLLELAVMNTESLADSVKAGEIPNQNRILLLKTLLSHLKSTADYEAAQADVNKPKDAVPAGSKSLSPEAVKEIEREVLGIER